VLKPLFLWLAILWTFAIAFLCLARFGHMPKVVLRNADKYVHFIFHFVFLVLWVLYFRTNNQKGIALITILKVFLTSLLFGIFVEIAQFLFTDTRKCDLLDILANISGAFTASLIMLFIEGLRVKRDKISNLN
jgi:VanZ family protein